MASGRTSQWAWDAALPGCGVPAGTDSSPGRASGTLQRSSAQEPRTEQDSTPCPARIPPAPQLCPWGPAQAVSLLSSGWQQPWGHPQGEPPLREHLGHITAACLRHPQPVGTCGGAGSRGDTSSPFGGQRGSAVAPPQSPQPAPGSGCSGSLCLGWRWLFL